MLLWGGCNHNGYDSLEVLARTTNSNSVVSNLGEDLQWWCMASWHGIVWTSHVFCMHLDVTIALFSGAPKKSERSSFFIFFFFFFECLGTRLGHCIEQLTRMCVQDFSFDYLPSEILCTSVQKYCSWNSQAPVLKHGESSPTPTTYCQNHYIHACTTIWKFIAIYWLVNNTLCKQY